MTPLITDSIILVILFLSAVIAFMRGFIKEVLTIFSLIGAAAAAYIWGASATPFFKNWGVQLAGGENERIWGMIPVDIFGTVLGYGALFLGLFITLSILSHFIGKTAQDMGLGSVDRTLGFAFGLARGVLILALINIPLSAMLSKDDQPAWLAEAKTMILVNNASDWIVRLNAPEKNGEKTNEKSDGAAKTIKQSAEDTKKALQDTASDVKQSVEDTLKNEAIPAYTDQARDQLNQLIDTVEDKAQRIEPSTRKPTYND